MLYVNKGIFVVGVLCLDVVLICDMSCLFCVVFTVDNGEFVVKEN